MDQHGDRGPARPEGAEPTEEQQISATFLPYDDERLWVRMYGRTKGRSKRRSAPTRPSLPADAETTAPTAAKRLRRPVSFASKRIAAALVTLALPVSAFVVTGALARDTEPPTVLEETPSPILTPSPDPIDIAHLQAERVTSDEVRVSWKAPRVDGPLTYTVHRDDRIIAETTDTHFTDSKVKPQASYRYWVTATLSDGTLVESPQLLVTVPSETSAPEQPTQSATTTSSSPSPSRSPSASPSPSKTKVVWPSTDSVNGQKICTRYQTTEPSQPCYSPPPPSGAAG